MNTDQEDIVQKALKYLKQTTLTNYRIAKDTGLSEAGIGRYVNEKSKPTVANARLLVQYFENKLSPSNDEANQLSDIQFMNIPFVPIYAQAGYGKGYGDQEYIDSLPTIPVIVDKTYKGKYRVFEVKGDSMDDGSRKSLCEGDKILCREVRPELWQSKLHIKDWFFVICMKDNGILVKQILSHEVETGEIVCHSLNSLFDDFKMNLSEVGELYNVIKIVDRNTRI